MRDHDLVRLAAIVCSIIPCWRTSIANLLRPFIRHARTKVVYEQAVMCGQAIHLRFLFVPVKALTMLRQIFDVDCAFALAAPYGFVCKAF
jgi:hypothetical protein